MANCNLLKDSLKLYLDVNELVSMLGVLLCVSGVVSLVSITIRSIKQ